jgi:hypothetical protein
LKLPLPLTALMAVVFMAYCSTEKATASELALRAKSLLLA